jgi:NtrC-family two-component system sensor histidine kinase KinB
MPLSVKSKIQFGTLFLFLLLIVTSGLGIYFTTTLKHEAEAVLQDNYESISYCHSMQLQMDSFNYSYEKSYQQFEDALKHQERNVTEPGEFEATQSLRKYFDCLKMSDTSKQNLLNIQNEIQIILKLNMNAIQHKNDKAKRTAESSVSIIITLAVLVFMIGLTFSVNFPSILTKPINELSNAIEEISNKNYAHRIHIDNKDEFGLLADAFNVMAQRLEYFESSNLNKLMFEKSRAEAVINSLKDASIGIDKSNLILFANFQAVQLLGLKSEEVVGKTVEELSKKNDLFSFLAKNESSAPFKIVVSNRENYFIKEVIEVTQGEGNSKVIVLRNITSFKELDVAKTNFIATISHELKTPLAAADFSLKLLEDERVGTLSDDQRELIQNLKQDNQRVLKILSELLNMSQVEAGRIELDVQSVNPYLIIDHAIETVAASAKERKIEIKTILDKDLPLIRADAEKSTWVLNNFLTNAIKYSTEGGVINVIAKKENGNLLLSVEDHGPGIAQEYLSRLFERYFQVPGSKAKGTGLGLGISKEFIEAQKGEIWVKSEIGKGSVFSFSLPTV